MARQQGPDLVAEPESAAVPVGSEAELSLGEQRIGRTVDPSALIGRVIGDRYRVLKPIGEGGMGAVFAAEHVTLQKHVALKVIRAELSDNSQAIERFAREAMTTARFEHPHVASAIDYGTLPEGGAYFVMQLVQGRSMRRVLIEDGPLPWRRACELFAQVADALSAAKAAGIIHRDLKPDNILVEAREDGSELVKVLDFGIAHVMSAEVSPAPAQPGHGQLTRAGMVIGTIGYMAPEQATAGKVDHRTDLYAFGVVLWQCITGAVLWKGDDFVSVLREQLTSDVPALRSRVDDATLPPQLEDLVQRLTARAPEDRPDHAAEVRDTLRSLARTPPSRVSWARPLPGLAAARVGALRQARRIGARLGAAGTLGSGRAGRALRASCTKLGIALHRIGSTVLKLGQTLRVHPRRGPVLAAGLALACCAALVALFTSQPKAASPGAPSAILGKLLPVLSLPAELSEAARILDEGKTLRERRAAAQTILQFKPESRVPAAMRRLAEFETARNCSTRKRVLADMREHPDPSYLPALRRLDAAPRSGCGFLDLSDCYACTRGDVRQTLDALDPPKATDTPGEKPAAK